MNREKQTCKILKEIRKQIAGVAVIIFGISVGLITTGTVTSCTNHPKGNQANDSTMMHQDSMLFAHQEDSAKVEQIAEGSSPDTIQSSKHTVARSKTGKTKNKPVESVQESSVGNTSVTVEEMSSLPDNDPIMTEEEVDTLPAFPGGEEALKEFYKNNFKDIPEIAYWGGIEGSAYFQFVVEKDGSITDIQIVRTVDPYLDREALRVTKMMPHWIPGKLNGKTVRVKQVIPVKFHTY